MITRRTREVSATQALKHIQDFLADEELNQDINSDVLYQMQAISESISETNTDHVTTEPR